MSNYDIQELVERFERGGTLDADELQALKDAGKLDEITSSSGPSRKSVCDNCDEEVPCRCNDPMPKR